MFVHSWCDLSTPHYSSKEEKHQCAGQLGAKGVRGFGADSATKHRREAPSADAGQHLLARREVVSAECSFASRGGPGPPPFKGKHKAGKILGLHVTQPPPLHPS